MLFIFIIMKKEEERKNHQILGKSTMTTDNGFVCIKIIIKIISDHSL